MDPDVEAAAKALARVDTDAQWNALMDHEQRRYREDARRALDAVEAARQRRGNLAWLNLR